MSLSSKVFSILASIFDNEIYPVRHPDPTGSQTEVSKTYAVFTTVGGSSFNALGGDSNLSRPRLQISIYSVDYDDLKSKEEAVASAMIAANNVANVAIENGGNAFTTVGALPNVSCSVPIEGFEPNTKRYYSHSEFYCWQSS